jgi:competence protein ComEA
VREQIETRLSDLARRAGMAGVPPAAVAAVAVVLALAVVGALWRWWPRDAAAGIAQAEAGTARSATASSDASSAHTSAGGAPKTATPAKSTATVTVHVVGAVLHPGVYELPGSARVQDAVSAAGGLAGNGAQASVNLARLLADGEQIVIPTEDEYAKATAGAGTQNGSGASKGVVNPGGASVENPGAPSARTVVNINTADAAALDSLPGVGPSTAAKIVADRETNGPFASADDLGRVSGIGPKKLEALKDYIRVQ